ncbi:MAG: SurA N-terminal domain-containing protein [Alphaproteobacteria bacterium]|nr:SurA N-terminal domain-containing protein [Alphaproteobacteria bacterium]MBU1560957.1 SurA N-terminal domain-containing protein [Alphaproteobacteria bacterium]MBU2304931.1 SurA N-terminal domain-containing protein [Alphaproteobacteria bacterium]MBU2370182.1 SurA N-terminal domain-containing protein [Alphaproteobacteria bacterium]
MLDSLRVFAKSWPGKVMGAFLLVGVAGFGINNVITDLGTNTVARVGDEEINSREFLRAYQNQLNEVAQQLGSFPTAEEAVNLGIPSMVLQNLAQDAALNRLATGFGLGVSEQKLSDMLRADPSFHNALGTFTPENFNQVLQMSGLTEAEYFEDQSDAARRQQLILSLFGDTALPETASGLINRYVADQRTIDYFALGETNIETPAAPTEAELAAYLAEHQAEFRTVETRNVQMLRLSAAELAATKTISEEAIAAEYERTKANLTRAERRTIQQVVLNADQVAAFEAGLAAGTPFETLVAEAGITPTDLGTLAQADITDANLATAAFGLQQGDFALIDGVAGKRAVHVSAIEAGGVPALDDVREQISQTLALAEARNELGDVQDQIEELRAAFRPLTEIAERFGLDLYEADVTAGGAELTVIPDLAAEDSPRVAQAIFKAEEGALTAAVPLAGNGNLWFDLNTIEPARDQTLDEVRDAVAEALTTERTNNAILAAQADAVARLDNGEALADIAASYNVFPQISAPFTRFGSEDGTIDGAVASAAFAGDENHHGSAVSQGGEFIVFQVTDLTPATGPLEEAANASLENEARIGLYGDFVSAVRDDAGLRINQQALSQALALNTGQ